MAEVRLMTAGVLAEKAGIPLSRVNSILQACPHIQPVARAGTLRVFDKKALRQLKAEIDCPAQLSDGVQSRSGKLEEGNDE